MKIYLNEFISDRIVKKSQNQLICALSSHNDALYSTTIDGKRVSYYDIDGLKMKKIKTSLLRMSTSGVRSYMRFYYIYLLYLVSIKIK